MENLLLILLIILVIVLGPLLLIWSLNTLFGLAIAYNLSTWFAAFVLGGVVSRSASSSKK
jgi:hypothetical protein